MVDAFILFLLFVVCIGGFSRGLLGQAWSLATLVVATLLTGKIYLFFVGLASQVVHDEASSKVLAFVVIFIALNAILTGPVYLMIDRVRGTSTDSGDVSTRLAAAVVGAIAGVAFIQVAAAILVTYPILGWDGWVKSSGLVRTYVSLWPFMFPLLPPEFQHALQVLR